MAKTKEVLIKPPASSLIRFGGDWLESVLSSRLMHCIEVWEYSAIAANVRSTWSWADWGMKQALSSMWRCKQGLAARLR